MRARSWAETQSANQRTAQKLPDLPAPNWGGGGGGSALWLDSLILNNLAVVLAPVLVGVGVLVLPASIIHMQLTA